MLHLYELLLIGTGVMMLAMGGFRLPYARRSRALNLIFGAGFTVYGLYLLLFFHSGNVVIFNYVFILPILMAVRFFRARSAYRSRPSRQNPSSAPDPRIGAGTRRPG